MQDPVAARQCLVDIYCEASGAMDLKSFLEDRIVDPQAQSQFADFVFYLISTRSEILTSALEMTAGFDEEFDGFLLTLHELAGPNTGLDAFLEDAEIVRDWTFEAQRGLERLKRQRTQILQACACLGITLSPR